MKKASFIFFFCALIICSCTKVTHEGANYTMEGYALRITKRYYTDVESNFKDFKTGNEHRRGNADFTELDDNTWQCQIKEENKTDWRNTVYHSSSDLTVTIFDTDELHIFSIHGIITEDEYVTRVDTLGEGIRDSTGILHIDVLRSGILQGWAEVAVNPKGYDYEVTVGN